MDRVTVLNFGIALLISSFTCFVPLCDAKVAPGDLDTTFGANGMVTTDLGGVNGANALAIDSSGKIVVAGVANVGDTGDDFALARYNTDGSPDTTFGINGKVTTDFNGANDTAYALAIDSQGRIIVAGTANIWRNYWYNYFALARYNTDGNLDATFGTDGKVTTDFGQLAKAYALAIDSSGKVVVAGGVDASPDLILDDFALARYNTDGSLDTTFGTNGMVTTDFGENSNEAKAIAIDSSGKILLAGFASIDYFLLRHFALARYNTDGSLDTTFGTKGKVMTEFGERSYDHASAMASDSSGKIVLAGSSDNNFALARYLAEEPDPPTGSITINGGAEATKNAEVTLTLTANDDTPGAIRMCISNKPTCTSWTAFAATKSWTLTAGNGTKTVYVWFKDVWRNVNVTPYSDTIILDTTDPTDGTVTATPGDAQATLDWSGFADALSGIGKYKVVFAAGTVPLSCSDGIVIYSGTDASHIHTELTNGTKYGYRVCAVDKAGNISAGATASAKPIPETNPPTGSITIKGGAEATKSTAVTLTLTASDDTPGAIRMCIGNKATCTTWTAFAAAKNWMLTTGNGTKTVYVWFKDMWGNMNTTPYSDTILLDTIAPTNGTVTATPGDAQVTLDWTGFTDTGSGIGSYKVVFSKGSAPTSCAVGEQIYQGTDTTYTHTGLTNGTVYYYRVCAIDEAGNKSTGKTAIAKPQ